MARTTGSEQSADKQRGAEGEGHPRWVEELHGLFKDIAPGRSLVDELIAERRAIGRAEEADYSQRQDGDD